MKIELIHIIKSLSSGEKRSFKLQTKKKSGNKAYVDLFDIISKSHIHDKENIEKEFRKLHPNTSIEATSQYLFNKVTDTLVQIRIDQEPQFQIYHRMMRSMLFFERSLSEEGFQEIKKVLVVANQSQSHIMHYQAIRMYLDYVREHSFLNKSEQDVIDMQSQGKNVLNLLRQLQEHHSLYELLEFRLIHSGKSLSEVDRKKMDDLVLSELILITQRFNKSFEVQKLHLLFQSIYFTHTGEFASALKIFSRLTVLFENNKSIWSHPPYDYLRTLEGILDNLRTMRMFDEMKKYIREIEELKRTYHHSHFIKACEMIINTFSLICFIQKEQWRSAEKLIKSLDHSIINNFTVSDHNRFTHLIFYISQTYFCLGKWNEAGNYLQNINLKSNHQSALSRATSMINIIIHYENDNLEFLDYEIRNYKRTQKKNGGLTKIEKMILKVIKFDPNHKSTPNKISFNQRILPKLEIIQEDKYEFQLIKYFDFIRWIQNKLKH